jgi:hypothetical protein
LERSNQKNARQNHGGKVKIIKSRNKKIDSQSTLRPATIVKLKFVKIDKKLQSYYKLAVQQHQKIDFGPDSEPLNLFNLNLFNYFK